MAENGAKFKANYEAKFGADGLTVEMAPCVPEFSRATNAVDR